jgi:hypothetical protein
MNNHISWLGTPESRIISIRKFRQYIDELPFEKAVDLTRENWNSGPRINKPHFDIAKVEEWPTPWDLFSQNTFCANSQALGFFYTLVLSEHGKQHDIKLAITEDIIFGEQPLIIMDNEPIQDLAVSCMIGQNDIKNKLGRD